MTPFAIVYLISCLVFLLTALSGAMVAQESAQVIRTKDVQRAFKKVSDRLLHEAKFFIVWPVRLAVLSFLCLKSLKK